MTADERRFRRTIGVPSRLVSDRVILARPNREDFDSLEGSAVAVWRVLDRPRTMSELVLILADAYRTPRDVVEEDVRSLLTDLTNLGVVDWASDDG